MIAVYILKHENNVVASLKFTLRAVSHPEVRYAFPSSHHFNTYFKTLIFNSSSSSSSGGGGGGGGSGSSSSSSSSLNSINA